MTAWKKWQLHHGLKSLKRKLDVFKMKSSSLVEFPGSFVLNKLVPMESSKKISTDVF